MRLAAGAALVAILAAGAFALGSHGGARRPPHPVPTHSAARRPAPARPQVLRATRIASLPAPVQDPATAALADGRIVAMGGLDSSDVSVDAVTSVRGGSARRAGVLPVALHDASAAASGSTAYLFGGGEPSHDGILAVGANGRAAQVGRLPAPASDVSAAALGGRFYVVGGYTGTAALDTIVEWRPGAAARVVAHLPQGLRYAAVTAAAGRLVIAGGTVGTAASRAVYSFDPAQRTVRRIATLPRPLTHAAAAAIGDRVYLIGGRGSALGSQTSRILALDVRTGGLRPAGHLLVALSDAGAAAVAGGIVVAGGRDRAGTVHADVLRLAPAAAAPRAHVKPAAYRVPAPLDPHDVYAADRPNALSPVVRHDRPLIYVPNSRSNTVDEIDPHSFRIVRSFRVGALPQHVVPSYDLKTLWVNDDMGNTLTPINPRDGRPGKPVHVTDPYNLYFTPDGRRAVVMAERFRRIDFRDAHTMRLRKSLPVPGCDGVNHADFTADGRLMLASCEFGGRAIVVDVPHEKLVRTIDLRAGTMPQDVKLSPDGRTFYVADMAAGGVWTISAHSFRKTGLIHTGAGAHGLYVSRDSRYLYVSNRAEGSISLVAFRSRKAVRKWRLPAGASPDMGGVSANGRVLWLSGRYSGDVYAIDTRNGHLIRRITVGLGPHGLCVYPQPGRYSLGHTGVFR